MRWRASLRGRSCAGAEEMSLETVVLEKRHKEVQARPLKPSTLLEMFTSIILAKVFDGGSLTQTEQLFRCRYKCHSEAATTEN